MRHLRHHVAALADGQLDHDARDRALAHVARCPECHAALERERRTKRTVVALGDPPVPAGLTERLLALAPPDLSDHPGPPGGPPYGAAGGRPVGAGPDPAEEPALPAGDRARALPRRPGGPTPAAAPAPSAPAPPGHPYDTRPAGAPGAAGPGRRSRAGRARRRAASVAGGLAGATGLSLVAAFAVGGAPPPTGTPLVPPVGVLAEQHAATGGGLGLTDPGAAVLPLSARSSRPTPAPAAGAAAPVPGPVARSLGSLQVTPTAVAAPTAAATVTPGRPAAASWLTMGAGPLRPAGR